MADRHNDIWLDIFCPEDACLAEEERIALNTCGKAEDRDGLLEVFCPEESCEISSPTQLP